MIFKQCLEKNDVKIYLHLSIYITKYSDITDMHSFPQPHIYTHHLLTTNHLTRPPSSFVPPKSARQKHSIAQSPFLQLQQRIPQSINQPTNHSTLEPPPSNQHHAARSPSQIHICKLSTTYLARPSTSGGPLDSLLISLYRFAKRVCLPGCG